MTCTHLKVIDRVCHEHGLALGRTELVRLVCRECSDQEVCPVNSVFPVIESPADTFVVMTSMNVHLMESPLVSDSAPNLPAE